MNPPRLLILIVAYNAEKTIDAVLRRLPASRLPGGAEVLIIDDASADATFEKARRGAAALPGLRITVLANPVNQGYGGNQKIGYAYAIEHGFDVVVLLHGDGQYAPEMVPDLAAPVLAGEADACFGSRMMQRGAALKHGMPLYKYVGNRILTRFQNRVLGMGLSEFHSGYRVYSVAALRRLPFACNTNDFHFDTEIIIQFRRAGLRIREIPIPTYYGDEICHVNGMAYAWQVTCATLASRLQDMGVFYQRKFDVAPDRTDYGIKLGYVSSHTLAIAAVPDGARVLDLGCGEGLVARELAARGCRVTGVERAASARPWLERFLAQDLDRLDLPADIGTFDAILALDCLEHLESPERLLAMLRERLYRPGTRLIVTAPNVAFAGTRLGLLVGQFNYGKQGILDLTHKRLFTFRSLHRLLTQAGYRVTRLRGVPAPFPKALGDGVFSRGLLAVNRGLIRVWARLFAYQIYAEADWSPPLSHLLARTVEFSAARAVPPTCG